MSRNFRLMGASALGILAIGYGVSQYTAPVHTVTSSPAPATAPVHEKCQRLRWYMHPKGLTLNQAIAEDQKYQAAVYPQENWNASPGSPRICKPFHQAGLSCSGPTRMVLADFLAINGKGLFPLVESSELLISYRPNPASRCPTGAKVNDGYDGTVDDNEKLSAAVRRNIDLFHGGDLTAEDVRTKWH